MADMIEIANKIRHELDARAADLDRAGGFPDENYERMAEVGYLRAPVPVELGGLGAGLAEAARAQRALGWACGSTAIAVNMHLFQVGAAADGWRDSGANEGPLRKVADEGFVLASTAAEAIVAGSWTTSTRAVRDGDDYVISGRKFFCSQADRMDVCRVNALDEESGDILVFAVPSTLPGVRVVETWDTLGMRGSASHDLVLEGVRMPASAVGVRLPADGPAWHPPMANVIRWFLSLATGVYMGIADRAREAALDSLGQGSNSAFRDPALTDVLLGQLEAAHVRATAVFEHTITRLDAFPDDKPAAMALAVTMKEEVTSTCIDIVDRAVEIAGGRSYFRTSVLERLVRDVRASRFHPPSAPVSHQMIGMQVRRGLGSPA